MDGNIDNARELVLLLWHECHKYVAEKKFDSHIDYLARIITAYADEIRRECLLDIKAAIRLDKETFAGVGRDTKGHARSLMLIDEMLAVVMSTKGAEG